MDLGSERRESGDQQHAHHHPPPQSQSQSYPQPQHPHPHPQQPQPLPVTPISLLLPSPQLQQQQQAASNSFHATTPVLPLHGHEIPKLKLLNTSSGNGGSKGDHHVAADQAREIVRQAVVAVTEAGAGKQQQSSVVKKGTVRYRECQKNHAASIGGHSIDGCGEFMPGGVDGSVEALRCAACECHRNFHRREVEGEIVCDCKKLKPKLLSTPQLSQAPGMTANTTTTTSTLALPSSQQLGQMTPLTMAALSAGGGRTDSDEPDDGPPGHMMMSMRSPSAIKKRFRTKFTTEQKDQMCAFAEKVGWRIQKHDEAAVQEFCTTVGVKRHVLKVWMHNNKNTMGKSKP